MDILPDFELSSIQELQADEKAEVWKTISGILSSAYNTEPNLLENDNAFESTGRKKIPDRIQRNYEGIVKIHEKLAATSGSRCHQPEAVNSRLKLSSPSKDRLMANIDTIGLSLLGETPSDGNCFWHAVSSQLQRLGSIPMNHSQLRRDVVEFIQRNQVIQGTDGPIHFESFVFGNLENYCNRMSIEGEWADHVAVLATARMLEKDILVVTSCPSALYDDILTWIVGKAGFIGDPLLLGHIFENHYVSLQPKGKIGFGSNKSSVEDNIDTTSIQFPCRPLEHKYGCCAAETTTDECQSVLKNTPIQQGNNLCSAPQVAVNKEEDNGLIALVGSKTRKERDPAIVRSFEVIRGKTNEEYVQRILNASKELGEGNFCCAKKNKDTLIYYCERHSKSSRKSCAGEPTVSRANACTAYISFKFEYISAKGLYVAIVRRKITHINHDITSVTEKRVSRISESLKFYIESLILQGKKNMEILVLCCGWAKSRGHTNYEDREFYPTPQDIKYLREKVQAENRYHKDDAVSVDYLCTSVMAESVIHYQRLERDTPLLIVYQNSRQLERLREYGRNIVFLDASYKGLTSYGYAVYCLQARDVRGHGTPLSYFVTSSDTARTLEVALQALKSHAERQGILFEPRSFMVDKDAREISAIQAVFPHSSVLLCWFHVLQAIYRWLNQRDSGVSGTKNAEPRKHIIDIVRNLKHTSSQEEFNRRASCLPALLEKTPAVLRYLQSNWIPNSHMWANHGRRFYHEDHETNNLVERFFLALKYNFLGGFGNRRVDQLLLLLDGDISQYHDYMEELVKVGRLDSKRAAEGSKGEEQAQQLLLQGWAQKCEWVDELKCLCLVPSQSNTKVKWQVDLVHGLCTCPAAARGGMCKHIHVAQNIAAMRNIDVQKCRTDRAVVIYEEEQFSVDHDILIIYDDDMINTVIQYSRCSCVAASHGITCVCQIAANLHLEGLMAHPRNEFGTPNPTTENRLTPEPHVGDIIAPNRHAVAGQQLKELSSWIENKDLEIDDRTLKVFSEIKKVHAMALSKRYINISKKRKIERNSSYRHKVDMAKKRILLNDHSYSDGKTGKRPKTESNSFKRASRKVWGRRTTFM